MLSFQDQTEENVLFGQLISTLHKCLTSMDEQTFSWVWYDLAYRSKKTQLRPVYWANRTI